MEPSAQAPAMPTEEPDTASSLTPPPDHPLEPTPVQPPAEPTSPPPSTTDAGPGPQPSEYTPPVDDRDQTAAPVDVDDEDPPHTPPVDDEEEKLEPKTAHVERVIGPDEHQERRTSTYIQKPLTYFGKIQLYGLLGRAVKIVTAGDSGIGLDQLLDMTNPKDMFGKFMANLPGADTAPDAVDQEDNIEEATKMLAAFSQVIAEAPQLLLEAYCIVLNVPLGHRKWAIEWGLPTIDDEMGTDILHVFIDQNWGVMEDFFTRELPKLAKRAVQARARHKSAGGR